MNSSAVRRGTPEGILRSAEPPQVAEGLETRFDRQALIDRVPHRLGITW